MSTLIAVSGGYITSPGFDPGWRLSSNGGATFQATTTAADAPPGGTWYAANQMAVADDGNILAALGGNAFTGTGGSEVWRGLVSGGAVTWHLVHTDAGAGFCGVVNIGAGRLVALRNDEAIFRSSDNGATWTQVSTLPGNGSSQGQIFSPATDVVICSGFDSGNSRPALFKSVDGGGTWAQVYTATAQALPQSGALAFAKASNGDYLAFGAFDFAPGEPPDPTPVSDVSDDWVQVVRSTDGGATWAAFKKIDATGETFYAAAVLDNGRIVAGKSQSSTGPNVFYSDDDGATWTAAGQLPPGADLNRWVSDFADVGGGVVVASGGTSSPDDMWVWRSTDHGATWARVTSFANDPSGGNVFGCGAILAFSAGDSFQPGTGNLALTGAVPTVVDPTPLPAPVVPATRTATTRESVVAPAVPVARNNPITPRTPWPTLDPPGAITPGVTRRYASVDLDTLPTFYDGQLVGEPDVARSLFETFWGPVTVETIRFALANVGGALTAYHQSNPRGRSVVLRRHDAYSGYLRVAFTGRVASTALAPGLLWVTAESLTRELLLKKIPSVLIDRETYANAIDLNAVIPVVFGNAPMVRLPNLNNDPDNQHYDWTAGWGAYTIDQLYRESGGERLPIKANRAVTIESRVTATFAGGVPMNWPQTVGRAATDRALLVIVQIYNGSGASDVSAVSWAGVAATRVGLQEDVPSDAGCLTSAWVIMAPPVGTALWSATPAGADDIVVTSLSLIGVLGTMTPADWAFAVAQDVSGGFASTPTLTRATTIGELALGVLGLSPIDPATTPVPVITPDADQTTLWAAGVGGVYSQGGAKQVTDTVTTFTFELGTPIDPSPPRYWTVASVRVKPAPAYAVSTTLYPGQTTVRFTYNPDPGGSGQLPTLYADVLGLQAERDFSVAIRTIIENATWSWGQTANAASFLAAAAALATVVPPLLCDGAMTAQEEAQVWLSELLMVRGMRLWLDEALGWTLLVDTPRTVPALAVRDGAGDGERNIATVGELAWDAAATAARAAILGYREDVGAGQFFFTITRMLDPAAPSGVSATGQKVGEEKRLTSRFVRDHGTADVVDDFIAKRLGVGQQACVITLPQVGRALQEGDLIRATRADIGLNGALLEVARVNDKLETIEVTARTYDLSVFSYSPGGTKRPDPDPDPGAWQDYSRTPPDPATNLALTATGTEVVGGTEVAWVDLAWDAPATNATRVILRYRLTPFAETETGDWTDGVTLTGAGANMSGRLTGLVPGEYYDLSVRVQNGYKLNSSGDPELLAQQVSNPAGAPATPLITRMESVAGGTVGPTFTVTPPLTSGQTLLIYHGFVNNPRLSIFVGFGNPGDGFGEVFAAGTIVYYWGRSRAVGGETSGYSPSEFNSVEALP